MQMLVFLMLSQRSLRPAVPNLFGTRGWFHGRQFFHGRGWGWGVGSGGNASDGSGGNASNGELQMKLYSLARHSPPAVRPGS